MSESQESLFSLELVVEKIYLPYVTCRFPAVAFRLLDFPTILISHVEKELSDSIKKKINADPYYRVPNQFAELQDKHGNFLVKKGKSCLFKLTLETLAMHLANTPMYIMVIDEFPEVPKLLGNSSLALNEIVDLIKTDVRQNGNTVPSVHGDKGLFKIYSLMGKEIGYIVMGFRLLSLGPGMIAHLPSSALAKRASERKKGQVPPSVIEEIMEVKEDMVQSVSKSVHSSTSTRGPAKSKQQTHTREMGSMTQVDKCDALMQTLDIENEKVHVEVSSKETSKPSKTIETQTERRSRAPQRTVVDFEIKSEDTDSDDGLIINPNINCPPPLFYNSKAEPDVCIQRDVNTYVGYSTAFDDETLDDLSGDEHIMQKSSKPEAKQSKQSRAPLTGIVPEQPRLNDAQTVVISNIKGADKPLNQAAFPGLNLHALTSEPAFPLLTALLTELSKIQNPQFVSEAIKQVDQAKGKLPQEKNIKANSTAVLKSKTEENVFDITELNENVSKASVRNRNRKSQKTVTQPGDNASKQKGFLRKAPEVGVKKTKLVFGLTNTQRLRLAKQNPNWLKTAEQEEKASKAMKKMTKTKEHDFDGDTGNLSDTYTEVRRLAAAELAKATLGKSQLINEDSKTKRTKKSRSRDGSPAKKKSAQAKNRSAKSSQFKGTVKVREDTDYDSGDALGLDPESREIESPEMSPDKMDSAADSVPSSKLEVHIPSARAHESDDNTLDDSFEDEPESDKKQPKYKFPGFNEGDETLPDSIAHDDHQSFNTTIDDDSPLESTRVSKQFRPSHHQTGDSLFKSTEDFDTRQFQSTDEPELQNLISEAEKTDTLPTPPTDRSVRSQSPAMTATNTGTRLSMKFEVLNPKASQQSPLPATRRSQQLRVDSMNARPTPTDTPRSRSSLSSRPSPVRQRPLKERRIEFKKESIHTESVSSYAPSETENILSLISDGSYSDDFHMSSEKDESSKISVPDLPKLIPSTKLGFTIG